MARKGGDASQPSSAQRAATPRPRRGAVAEAPAPEASDSGGKTAKAEGGVPTPKPPTPKPSRGWLALCNNLIIAAILLYAVVVAYNFKSILWPDFGEVDPARAHTNVFKEGDMLRARIWVDPQAFPSNVPPLLEFEFKYHWDEFRTVSRKVNASITQEQLSRDRNLILSTEVVHPPSKTVVRAKGGLVKSVAPQELAAKYRLLKGEVCPVPPEPSFGKPKHIGKGIPKMEVRLVFDTTAYPPPYARGPWTPSLFVDHFWMTNDQLVKLNTTGDNHWESEVHFNLMGIARFRFQRHMEQALSQLEHIFGESSEESLQVRDLFANTHPYLLALTLVVSVLEILFQYLAFKNDVEFFQGMGPEALSKYVSVQSIIAGVVMEILLMMYLWDESASLLVCGFMAVSICIDIWKIFRAMKLELRKAFGFLPYPALVPKVQRKKQDDFDTQAMGWLSMLCAPFILAYAGYSLATECHRGWYSFVLFVAASCVYSLGFVLMTPQLFINYKHKTVAYLPWRKFVYRAITTFIDDLYAMVVRMPTMHRLSCFRDDVVFFIYLYQRRIYAVDRTRVFDEDGYELSSAEVAARAAGGGGAAEGKKEK